MKAGRHERYVLEQLESGRMLCADGGNGMLRLAREQDAKEAAYDWDWGVKAFRDAAVFGEHCPPIPAEVISWATDWLDALAEKRFGPSDADRQARKLWRDPLGKVGRLAMAVGLAS